MMIALYLWAAFWSIAGPISFAMWCSWAYGAPNTPEISFRKGGVNDLSRWRQFGGTLERPERPMTVRQGEGKKPPKPI